MPTYDYVCTNGHRFEVIHGVHDAGPLSCPVCHSRDVRKAIVASAVHFKGSGWAKKDRGSGARKSSSSSGSEGDSSRSDGAAPAAKSGPEGSGSDSGSGSGSGSDSGTTSTRTGPKESSGPSSPGTSEPG